MSIGDRRPLTSQQSKKGGEIAARPILSPRCGGKIARLEVRCGVASALPQDDKRRHGQLSKRSSWHLASDVGIVRACDLWWAAYWAWG